MIVVFHSLFFFLLLFFKHRYAATGDADGEPISISRDEEFEKMERLEKEVLDYPGLVFRFSFFFFFFFFAKDC